MRIPSSLLGTLALSAALLLTACGQEEAPAKAAPSKADTTALRKALFEPLEPGAFQQAIAAARAGGVHEQAIMEARFLTLIDLGNHAGIGQLVPEMKTLDAAFDIKNSAIFSTREEWHSVIEYSQALAALEKNDRKAFKQHITEAYWLSPRQGTVFAPHIEQLRLKDAMKKVRLDFERTFAIEDTGQQVSLKSIAGDTNHLLLHFWSPWSQECEAYLGDFTATSNELAKNKIAVAAVLAEPSPEVMPDSKLFRDAITEPVACSWLVDDKDEPITRLFRVQNLPTVVLADSNGVILFNGHPSDPALWNALQQVAPNITRPTLLPEDDPLPPLPGE